MLGPIDDAPDCIAIGDMNQQALFPRIAAVVHHGGAAWHRGLDVLRAQLAPCGTPSIPAALLARRRVADVAADGATVAADLLGRGRSLSARWSPRSAHRVARAVHGERGRARSRRRGKCQQV